jgi:hypothetical protein
MLSAMEHWELKRIDRLEEREEKNAERIRELEWRESARLHLNVMAMFWVVIAASWVVLIVMVARKV